MRIIKAKDFIAPWAIFVIGTLLVGVFKTALVVQVEHLTLIAGGSIATVKMVAYSVLLLIGVPLSFLIYYWCIKQFLIPKIEASNERGA
jgi:hypothetical protein